MKIQYASDLHLEGADIRIKNNAGADLLILAGDITTAKSYQKHYDFFRECSESFRDVVHVYGNHEYYRGDIEETEKELKEFFSGFKNIHSLQNESIDLDSHRLFGSTLWTDCNGGDPVTTQTLSDGMNDYRIIQWKSRKHWKLRPHDTMELHKKALGDLEYHLETSDKPMIVVTHHAPSPRSTHIKYGGSYHMNGGYRSDLEWIMEKYDIPLWFHGHMHDSVDYTVNKTRVLSNPRGYMIAGRDGKRYTENEFFDPKKGSQYMKIGFTGTQKGMTSRQKEIFRERLRANMGVHPNEFHHGDCIGADEEACGIAIEEGFEIHCHPPHNDSKRAHTVYDVLYPSEDYLVRNHIIVDSVSQMISTPKEKEEQLRSGTWATIRYTKKKGVPLDIIYP